MTDKFLKYLQQTKMNVWQRGNPIIQQILFIIVRAKGDFILFDGVELMFKWSYTLHGMHNILSSKKQLIVLITNVFFDYVFLHSLCLLLSFFFVFNEYIFALKPTNSSIISLFNSSFILPITFLFSSL